MRRGPPSFSKPFQGFSKLFQGTSKLFQTFPKKYLAFSLAVSGDIERLRAQRWEFLVSHNRR
jgi:hypothetical protein